MKTGSNRNSKVVHLASAPITFTWKGEEVTAYDRACNSNKGTGSHKYLDDRTLSETAEVTCKRCQKLA